MMPDVLEKEIETPIDHNFHQIQNEKIKRWESFMPPEYGNTGRDGSRILKIVRLAHSQFI